MKMSARRLLRLLPAVVLCNLAAMPVSAQSPAMADVVTLNSGAAVSCKVLEATPEKLVIEYRAAGAFAATRRDVPWSDLKTVDFAMDDEFRALLLTGDFQKDGARLKARWEMAAPLLARPHHPAGDLGLAYARLLGRQDAPEQKQATMAVCLKVEQEDWNPFRQAQAAFVRAGLLTALGKMDDALALYRTLVDRADPDPRIATEAHLAIASLLTQKLLILDKENPRWQEDDRVRPQREQLFHDAVDHCLKPCLFYGSVEETSARGLWKAVELHVMNGDTAAAGQCAQDILFLYEASPPAPKAREFLVKNHLPTTPPAAAGNNTPVATPPAAPAQSAAPRPEEGSSVVKRPRKAKPDGMVPPTSPNP